MNQRGYSLVSVLVGIVLSGIVLVGIGQAMLATQQGVQRVSHGQTQSQVHFLSLQSAQSTNLLRDAISADAQIKDCLNQKGTQCTSLPSSTGWRVLNAGPGAQLYPYYEVGGKGALTQTSDAILKSLIEYRLICSTSERCEKVDVRISTAPIGKNPYKLNSRESVLSFPARYFVGDSSMDLSCAGKNAWMSTMNFTQAVGQGRRCQTIVLDPQKDHIQKCSNNLPKSGFGRQVASGSDCVVAASENCTAGFGAVGVIGQQSSCFVGTLPDTTSASCSPITTSCVGKDLVAQDSCGKEVQRTSNSPACAVLNVCRDFPAQCQGADLVTMNSCGVEVQRVVSSSSCSSSCSGFQPSSCNGTTEVIKNNCGNIVKTISNSSACASASLDCSPQTFTFSTPGGRYQHGGRGKTNNCAACACTVTMPSAQNGEVFHAFCRDHDWNNMANHKSMMCVNGMWQDTAPTGWDKAEGGTCPHLVAYGNCSNPCIVSDSGQPSGYCKSRGQ